MWAVRDGFPPDAIVEAIVFGELTEATIAAIEARNRVIRRESVRDELEYCRMRSSMAAVTGLSLSFEKCVVDQTGSTVEELYGPEPETDSDDTGEEDGTESGPVGSGGLLDYSLIPGPDGSMLSEAITLSVDGTAATLKFDLAFRTAVEYEDEEPVCWDNFTFRSGASNLTVDGAQVTGTTDLILDFDGATQCPEAEQDDIGVPQTVDITGRIDGNTFTGELSIEGISIPFAAAVG